jgi:putative ABC transport system permease protein
MFTIVRLWNVFRRKRLDAELRQELDAHLALLEEEESARGLSISDAQRNARARFGNPLLHRERSLDAITDTWLETAWRDAKYGARQLAAAPLLSAVLIVTLGLGIGATVAIFSVVNAVLLQPLPYANGDRLVMVWETWRESKNGAASAGPKTF